MASDIIYRPAQAMRVGGLYGFQYSCIGAGCVLHRQPLHGRELICVERGEAEISASDVQYTLRQGQALVLPSGGTSHLWADGRTGAAVLVASFACNSPALRALRGRPRTLAPAQRLLLARLLAAGRRAFGPLPTLDDGQPPCAHPAAPRGNGLAVCTYLTLLLLELLLHNAPATPPPHAAPAEDPFAQVFTRTRELMCAALDGSLSFPAVCRAVGLSATVFKERFHRHTGMTVMDYYRRLRIEEARRRLRAGGTTIARVADELGYSSAAAFSRQFRQVMRMTPSDYLHALQA
jgi:AraC-like DNA-binding protein